ncbi:MAG TPA: tetratricopeptide repeat protein [Polyangiales bacterium]|jgi:TPR repeat protein
MIAGCDDVEECNRQCAAQQPTACVTAGHLYEFGRGVPADISRAFQLYIQACNLKFAGGCYNAAVLLDTGKGVDKDTRRAHELYAKVCAMGSKTACARATDLSEPGKT